MTGHYDIDTLNGLIEVTLDSVHGYGEAAKDARDARFQILFTSRSEERHRIALELQAQVRSLGGRPADDGTILGGARRMFMNLRAAMSRSDQGVVNEIEAGEDHVKAKFEEALDDARLSGTSRDLVARLYASVRADHDKMRDIKHSLQSLHI